MRHAWQGAIWAGVAAVGGAAVTPAMAGGFGPLERSWISRDATWLVHLDMETGGRSVFRRLMDSVSGRETVIATARAELGLDPSKDIKGVTIYGTGAIGEPVTVLLSTTTAVDGLAAHVDKLQRRVERFEVGSRPAFSFDEDDSRRYCSVIKTADDSRLVVLSDSRPGLERAVGVLDATDRSLAQAGSGATVESPAAGSVVFVAVGDTRAAFGAPAVNSVMLRTATAVCMDMGEREGQVYGRVAAMMESPEAATSSVQMAQGMLAMARLAMGTERDSQAHAASAMLNAVRIGAIGSLLTAEFSLPVESLYEAAAPLARQLRVSLVPDEATPGRRSLRVDHVPEAKSSEPEK